MTLTVQRIDFGATPAVSTGRAFLAKRNRLAQPSAEWIRGQGRNDLVYPFGDAKTWSKASIDVTLAAQSPSVRKVWVRTSCQAGSSLQLGVVRPTHVSIAAGLSQLNVTLPLTDVALDADGISRGIVRWRWEYSEQKNGEYVSFGESEHRLYVILRAPAYPWTVEGGGIGELIWTDVLDWSCRWAAGSEDEMGAAAAMTHRVHEIGGLGFCSYGQSRLFHWSGRDSFVLGGIFMCTDFLSLLSGETERARPTANCGSMASILATFANAVGCSLGLFRLTHATEPFFAVKPIRLIGLTPALTKAQMPLDGFPYHDVAGSGRGPAPTHVFDACLAVDVAGRGKPPFCWTAPAGFAVASYEGRLAASPRNLAWRKLETPSVERAPAAVPPPPDPLSFARYTEYRQLLGGVSATLLAEPDPGEYIVADAPVAVRRIPTRFSGEIDEQIWTAHPRADPGQTIWISVFPCGSAETARDVAAEMLAWSQAVFTLLSDGAGPRVLIDRQSTLGAFVARDHAVIVDGDGADTRRFVQTLARQMSAAARHG
jgi:hypothetical protein